MDKLEYCLIEFKDRDRKAFVYEPDGRTTWIAYPEGTEGRSQKVLVYILCFMGKMRWDVSQILYGGDQILMKRVLVEKHEGA